MTRTILISPSAAIAAVLLLAVSPNTPPEARVLSPRAITPGATFRYVRTVVATRAPVVRETMQVKILTVSSSGYSARITYKRPGSAPDVKEIVANNNGWHYLDGSKRPHDFLTVDPARFCSLPAVVATGSHWDCSAKTVWGDWPAGPAHVVVIASTPSSFQLSESGTGAPRLQTAIDDDTGQPVATRTTTTWHTLSDFTNDMLRYERTTVRVLIHVGDQALPVTFTTTIRPAP